MPLISFEVEFSISWIENCVTVANAGTAVTIKITDAKLYVPVVTLSTKDNAKLAKQLSKDLKDLFIRTNIK